MSKDFFRFKQFVVYHNRTAMKVGTDGVLIGAWCACEASKKVLDVGCGTGIVSLMVAQRAAGAIVDAVEIDADAAEEAAQNFERSPWANRLTVWQGAFQTYAKKNENLKYDLIVSNPPYFLNSLKNENEQRKLARHADSLPYEDLIDGVCTLLAEEGVFSAIFPYEEANVFVASAALRRLYCTRRMDVRGTPDRPVKRVLLEFSRTKKEPLFEELVIESGGRGCYSKRYRDLTGDFYLKF